MSQQQQTWSEITEARVAKWSESLKMKPEDIKAGIAAQMATIKLAKPELDAVTLENKSRFEWYRRQKSGFGGAASVLFEGVIWGPTEVFDMTRFSKWRQLQDYEEADADGKKRMLREGRIKLVESPNEIVDGKPKLIMIALDVRKHFDATNTAVEPSNPNYGKELVPVNRRKVAGLFRPAGEQPGPWRPGVIQLYNEDCFAGFNYTSEKARTDFESAKPEDQHNMLKQGLIFRNFLGQLMHDDFYNKFIAFNARIRSTDEKQRWLISLPQGTVMQAHPGIKDALIPEDWQTSDAGKVRLYSGAPPFVRTTLKDLQALFDQPAPSEKESTPFQAYCRDYDRIAVTQCQVISMSDRHIGIGNNYLMTVEEPNAEDFDIPLYNVWVNDELLAKYKQFGPGSIIELSSMPRSGKVYDNEAREMTDEVALQLNAYDMIAYPEWRTAPQGATPSGAEEVSSQ